MPKRKAGYETIEHTADVGIVAHGEELPELFINAAAGMFALMVEPKEVQQKVERTVEVEASDWEGLLVRWLSGLLYYLDAEGLVFNRFAIEEMQPYQLRAVVQGEAADPERHRLHFAVKAVTRHLLSVQQTDGGWQARILFDI